MRISRILTIVPYLITVGECGMKAFLVNGTLATINRHPHAAYLSIKCESNYEKVYYKCGSSILNQNLVLTAAHCVDGCFGDLHVTVYVGHEEKRKGAASTVQSIYKHEEFDPITLSSDICLVKVKTPFKLNPKTSRVAIMNNPPVNAEAEVTGWGITDMNTHETAKQLVDLKQCFVLSRDDCQHLLNMTLEAGTICAKSRKGSHIAQGDSGSALVVHGYIQIGIVSFRLKVTNEGNENIGVYTDTGYYYKWIENAASDIQCASNIN